MTITTQNEHLGSQLPCPQDIDIMAMAMNGMGWSTGGGLTEQLVPDMTLALASGSISIPPAPTSVAFTGNSALAIAPLATSYLWRIDIISVTHAGTVVVTTGDEQNSPVPPNIPGISGATPNVVLYFVLLVPGTTVLTNDLLMDKRCALGVQRGAIFAGAGGTPSVLPRYASTNTVIDSGVLDTGTNIHLDTRGFKVNTTGVTGGTFVVDGTGRITFYGNSSPLDGQLLIGNTGSNRFDKAALTAGSGISITNAAGGITVAATGSGSGDVVGPAASVTDEVALFSGTTGKLIKRSSATGRPKLTAGVQSVGAIDLASEVTGDLPYANLVQASAASRLLLRGSASGAGDWQEGTVGTGLALTGTVLSATGGAGSGPTTVRLTANATANATTTGVEITGLKKASTGTGTFIVKYVLRYQSSVAGNGIKFGINHTGTTPVFMFTSVIQVIGGGANAATQAQASPTNPGGMSTRSKSTTAPNMGPTSSVDTANADMLWIIEGLINVTGDGDLELWSGSEAAVSVQVMAESCLILQPIA